MRCQPWHQSDPNHFNNIGIINRSSASNQPNQTLIRGVGSIISAASSFVWFAFRCIYVRTHFVFVDFSFRAPHATYLSTSAPLKKMGTWPNPPAANPIELVSLSLAASGLAGLMAFWLQRKVRVASLLVNRWLRRRAVHVVHVKIWKIYARIIVCARESNCFRLFEMLDWLSHCSFLLSCYRRNVWLHWECGRCLGSCLTCVSWAR